MLRNKYWNINCFNYIRQFSSKSEQKLESFHDKPDPHLIKYDYIGPPDKESNLRPYVRCITENESCLAMLLRTKRIEVEEWNQSFWSKHNKRFYEEKYDFIRLRNLSGIHDISADKMSEFYKSFLDKNRRVHILYNISWYLKNLEILMLALQVSVQNVVKKLKTK
ncbi:COA8 family protein CG14806, mitochondrial [Calliphora vicina]|uniref:COA8 family protein CG14806, mitochondrial n=1 Tax=Calliphora vicina TaxID=7373 RepID=UPI00325AC7B6